eukprot:TRINITY_DN3366_c0_g1_i5.p2 TRINITY_DN3366_c0_g1~~TRINITY_DN3366_c0_g1_i5.p2  ORF type:complete len:181 (-),score=51.29 TRINITY_DN3366_c0_g1_i5:50-592(-)
MDEGAHQAFENLMQDLDQNNDGVITFQELSNKFAMLSESEISQLFQSCQKETSERRARIVDRIFAALDTNKDGHVDKAEITNWIRYESSFQSQHGNCAQRLERLTESLLKKIDANRDGVITREELESYFADWNFRAIRMVTQDVVYYHDVNRIQAAGYPVRAITVNTAENANLLEQKSDS